jgi:ribonuclease P protein component
MGIPASQRLRKQGEFQQVRSLGHRIHCGPFIVQCDLSDAGELRSPILGVIASRRVGNAVKRNRGKRLMREIFRQNAELLPTGVRMVVVLRAGYERHEFSELQARFRRACATLAKKASSKVADC